MWVEVGEEGEGGGRDLFAGVEQGLVARGGQADGMHLEEGLAGEEE